MASDLRSGFLQIFNAKLLISVIGIVTTPIVVRLLGSGGYGDYAFMMSAFSMLMIVVSSGITEGVQKFVAEQRQADHWKDRVTGFYLTLAIFLGILGALVLVLATWLGIVEWFLEPRFRLYFYLLAAFVFAAQLRAFSRHAMLGFGLERYSEPLQIVTRLVWFGVGAGLALLGLGVAAFLIGQIAAALAFALAGFVLLGRRVSIPETLRGGTLWGNTSGSTAGPTAGGLPTRELLTFNGLNIVLVFLLMSHFHVDVLMLRVMAGDDQTGYYKAALALAEYMWIVPISLQTLLLHSTSDLWSRDRTERIADLAATVTRYVFLLTAVMAVGVFALADRFVPLYYGSDFLAATGPLIFLLPGAVAFAMARPLYAINQATGRLWPVIGATGAAALPNVVLNYTLIPHYGMLGAAIATSTGYAMMFVFHVACARHFDYDPLSGMRPLRLLATVVVSGPIIVWMGGAVANDFLALAIVPPAGFIVFATTALAVGAADTDELLDAVDVLPVSVADRIRTLVSQS